MQQKAGAQISRKAFIQSFLILLALILAAGILTRVVPSGQYSRSIVDGREVIDPGSFQYTPAPDYPVWRWITAPVEVLWGPDAVTIITIILFILVVGVAFALMDKSLVLQASVGRIVQRFQGRKYVLLLVISFFFMLLGAFLGMFEEVVMLVPVMVALSILMGWDSLVGLGMSILATNMGFSAAITNPFTVGLAQKLAGLPMFSGAWLRVIIFLTVYAIFAVFLTRYARRIERDPRSSPMFAEDQRTRNARQADLQGLDMQDPRMRRAIIFLAWAFGVIILIFLASPFVEVLSAVSLPLVGLLFFIAGLGSSLLAGANWRTIRQGAKEGALGMAPGIPLILMAVSVKHIVAQGGIIDTILQAASSLFTSGEASLQAALLVFAVALVLEIFVSSSSAKIFLVMPILLPLGDLVGLTRQITVTAYCFGDGFTNMIYPTNAVLLIALGLATVPYGKWLRWTWKLWAWILGVTVLFLALAVAIRFGPF